MLREKKNVWNSSLSFLFNSIFRNIVARKPLRNNYNMLLIPQLKPFPH